MAIQSLMSTKIAIDTLEASQSIKSLTSIVNGLSSEWKAQERALEQSGDKLEASRTRYEGLGRQIEAQKNKIEALKHKQSEVTDSTQKGAEAYLKYEKQINTAETQLARMTQEQTKAKQALDYQKSGLATLQKEYKEQNQLSQSLVRRLEAEGKARQSAAEKLRQSRANVNNLTEQYQKQEKELKELEHSLGKTSSEYRTQAKRVNQTAESLAKAKSATKSFDRELKELKPYSLTNLKKGISGISSKLKESSDRSSVLKGSFLGTFAGNVISSAFTSGLNLIRGSLGKIKDETVEYVKYQQTMNATWLTLTGNADKGKAMTKAITDMAAQAQNSLEMVDKLNQKIYAIGENADQAKKTTKAILTLQDAFGQTDEAVENFGTQWSQMLANGKVQGQDMLSIINTFPKMKPAIMEVAGEMTKGTKLTADEYAKMQSEGKITSEMAEKALYRMADKYKNATENFAQTLPGLERVIRSRVPAITSAFVSPFMEMKTPALKALGDWVSDPLIEARFKRSGKKASDAFNTVLTAGLKAFNLGDSKQNENAATRMLDVIDAKIDDVAQTIAKNMPKIINFFGQLTKAIPASLSILFEVGKGFAGVFTGIAKSIASVFKAFSGDKSKITGFGDALQNISKHKEALQAVGKVLAVYFIGKKVITGISTAIKGYELISGAMAKTALKAKVLAGAQKALNLAMETSPWVWVATAVVAVGTALTVLYTKNKAFRDWVNKTAKGMYEFFKPVIDFAVNVGKAIGGAISSVVEFNKKTGVISKTLQVAFAPLKLIGAMIALPFKIALSALDGFNKHGLGGLIKGAGKALGSFGKFAGGVIKGAANMAAKAGKSISGFVGGALKGVGKFAGGVGKTVGKGFAGMQKLVSKAFGGSQKEAKKQTSKMSKQTQKDIQKMIKTTQKQLQTLQKSSKKTFADLPKNAQKAFKNAEKQVKSGQRAINKVMKAVDKQLKSFDKNYKKIFDAFAKNAKSKTDKAFKQTKASVSKIQKLVNSGGKWYKTLEKNTRKLQKTTGNLLNSIQKDFEATWNRIANHVVNRLRNMQSSTDSIFGKTIKNAIFNSNNQIKSNFKSTFDNVSSNYSNFWKSMKNSTGRGINSMIDVLNQGVNSINSLISSFGGSKNAIKTIGPAKYASGTGFFNSFRRPIDKPTYAMLNDGNDSPETDNRELVIMPNGQAFVPKERNFKTILPAGTEVLNAKETAELFGQAMPYASGTGFFPSLVEAIKHGSYPWFGKTIKQDEDSDAKKKAKEFIEKASSGSGIDKEIPKSVKGLSGSFSTIVNGMVKKVFDPSEKHWSTMWTMAKEAMEEAGSSVAMGAKGDDYRFKDHAKDAGADPWGYFFRECVSFIASRLANLGVNPGLFSHLGNGNQWGAARVPHLSRPKPGTVAVYTGGPVSSNHVSFVTGVHGDTMDGEEYNWMGTGQYHQYSNRPISSASTYLDFGVKSGSDSKDGGTKADVKADSPLRKLIKGQVGKMFDWIKEHLADPESGGEDGPQGSGVERWRSSVVKALKANGIDPTAFRVSKILSTIQRESNGDQNVQNNWDSNAAAGHPSIGLMQTIQPTFDAYAHSGHHNIRNGYDNLLAAINYIKHRYGTDDAAFNRVAAYGYANGGIVSQEGLYTLAEGNRPEYVIPTDISKRSRATQLLAKVTKQFADEDPRGIEKESKKQESNLADKLDQVIGLLGAILTQGSKDLAVSFNLDGKTLSDALAQYSTRANDKYSKRQNLIKGMI